MDTLVGSDKLFNGYFTDYSYDEMFSPDMQVKPVWHTLLANIRSMGADGLISKQNDLNWHLAENGVTYNVYNDPNGLNRPWHLNVMPFVINEAEWATIEKGIQQRSEIMNFILQDIYGKRELISKGIIPQEVIYSHRGFLRQCDQIVYGTIKNLLIHAVDMARGPDEQMWVINDRTQAPSGMGYALENRMTMSRVLPELSKDMHLKKLSEYFQHFNELLIDTGMRKRDNPNIVILTPGPHNETYFEHAYLASFLGYPLVQGSDLIVRDGYLWMKSLKGLKQVDVLLRRVDDMYADPLELREDSQLGVAGLLDVVRRQNVTVINPIGARVLENPGLIPFLPGVAKYYLNEELILPQIATWWCGQEKERQYVLDHLSELIVKRIDRSATNSIFFGYQMSEAELDELRNEISDRPYRFVAQEKISFSTTPTFNMDRLEPRNSVWRTFAIAHDKEYSVMPGGLVRVASERGNILVSNQRGGTSKDIWIVGEEEQSNQQTYSWKRRSEMAISGLDDLPSITAENLFWAGRYVGRVLSTARFIRMVLKQMNYLQFSQRKPNTRKSFDILLQAVTHLTGTYPGFTDEDNTSILSDPFPELLSVVFEKERTGSMAHTLSMFSNSYYSIRNLWSSDMWRVFERIENIWKDLERGPDKSLRKIIQSLDQLITRLIAFMGLVEESILIEQGLLLYFIGLQLEQSILNTSKCRSLLSLKQNEQVEYELLESLLTSHESLNIYRYSYRSYISLENVVNLVLLDPKYPRSLAYQLNRLQKDIAVLPHSRVSHELTDYEKCVFEALSKVRLAKPEELNRVEEETQVREKLVILLSKVSSLLFETSMIISNTYFSHTYSQNQLVHQNFQI